MRWRINYLLMLLLVHLDGALTGSVLTVITPGPQSHLFGMRKVTIEMAARGHKVAVSLMCPDLVTVNDCCRPFTACIPCHGMP